MDGGGGGDGRLALTQRPGTALVLARGEEAEEAQQAVGQPDHASPRRLGDAKVGHEQFGVLARQLADLLLELARQDRYVAVRLRLARANSRLRLIRRGQL